MSNLLHPAIVAALALFIPTTRLTADALDALGPAARSALARDKILIGTQEFKQSFQPYINYAKHGPDRLTDAAWMEMLKSAAPPAPAWLKPILQDPAEPLPPPKQDPGRLPDE